jgi:hypothetical protein
MVAMAYVFGPLLVRATTLGSGDWDAAATSRALVTKTLLRFYQFPFWNPYACGGHQAWGRPEADAIVVSPWLPAYLIAPLPIALRIEVIGSSLLGAIGAAGLASRFTRSRALWLLVAVLFALSSRATSQIAAGHMAHATYAYLPWAFYFYDRATGVEPLLGASRRRDIVLAAVCLALMVYAGGTYSAAHTALALAGYALIVSAIMRSWLPTTRMVLCGLLGAALSAPMLLPLAAVMARSPQSVDSAETMDLAGFVTMLTSRHPDAVSGHYSAATCTAWAMYIGWPAVLLIVIGLLNVRGVRQRALRSVGGVFVLLAFGPFADYAPWRLLRAVPMVTVPSDPSRWMVPALLLLACAAASAGERLMTWAARWRWLLEVGAIVVVALVVRDVCRVARTPMTSALQRPRPPVENLMGEFKTVKHVPNSLDYDAAESGASTLSAVLANIGSIDCSTSPVYSGALGRDKASSPASGARAVGDGDYRGEAYVAEGHGTARIVHFTPNAVEVRVEGAHPGDHVVLNQNWDSGWSANGHAAPSWKDAVAAVVTSSSATVRFRYWPPLFSLGLLILALTLSVFVTPWDTTVFAHWLPPDRRSDPPPREPRIHPSRRAPPPP